MADSTLDPDYLTSGPDRSLGRGHGTDALGPSDLSDTGADMQGAGLSGETDLGLDEGTTSDPERSTAGGTGERATAGRDSPDADGDDIDTDQIQSADAIDPEDTDVDAGR